MKHLKQLIVLLSSAALAIMALDDAQAGRFIRRRCKSQAIAIRAVKSCKKEAIGSETAKKWTRTLGNEKGIDVIAWDSDSRRLATASDKGIVRIWKLGECRYVSELKVVEEARKVLRTKKESKNRWSWITSMGFLGTENMFYTTTLFRIDTGPYPEHPDFLHQETSHSSSILQVWDISKSQLVRTVHVAEHEELWSKLVSPSNNLVAMYGHHVEYGSSRKQFKHYGIVAFWNVETGKLLWERRESKRVNCLQVSLAGGRVAWGNTDFTIVLANQKDGKVEKVIKVAKDIVVGLAFSPDGNMLAATSHEPTAFGHAILRKDGIIETWRLPAGKLVQRAKRVQDFPKWSMDGPIVFTNDSASIVCYGLEGNPDEEPAAISLWNVATGKSRILMTGDRICWALAPDGRTLAAARYSDSKLEFKDVDSMEE